MKICVYAHRKITVARSWLLSSSSSVQFRRSFSGHTQLRYAHHTNLHAFFGCDQVLRTFCMISWYLALAFRTLHILCVIAYPFCGLRAIARLLGGKLCLYRWIEREFKKKKQNATAVCACVWILFRWHYVRFGVEYYGSVNWSQSKSGANAIQNWFSIFSQVCNTQNNCFYIAQMTINDFKLKAAINSKPIVPNH